MTAWASWALESLQVETEAGNSCISLSSVKPARMVKGLLIFGLRKNPILGLFRASFSSGQFHLYFSLQLLNSKSDLDPIL